MPSPCIKIAISGTHSSGKTGLVHALASALRLQQTDCVVVPETARDCPLPIGPSQPLESAIWMVMTGIAREIVAGSQANVVLVDRPVLDMWAYTMVSRSKVDFGSHLATLLRTTIEQWMPTYDLVIATVVEPRIAIDDDSLRNTEPEFRRAAAVAIENAYASFLIRPTPFRYGDDPTNILDLIQRLMRPRTPGAEEAW